MLCGALVFCARVRVREAEQDDGLMFMWNGQVLPLISLLLEGCRCLHALGTSLCCMQHALLQVGAEGPWLFYRRRQDI